jgi:hypothetical protein
MEPLVAASLVISAGLAGLALGVSGSQVVQHAPEAFHQLDYRRADSLVRKSVKKGLPWIMGFSAIAALFALGAGAVGSGVILLVTAGLLFFVSWILDPLPKKVRMAGAVRKMSQQRILALQILAILTLFFPFALIALAMGV